MRSGLPVTNLVRLLLAASVTCVTSAWPALGATFTPLGKVGGSDYLARAFAVSADGATVVGDAIWHGTSPTRVAAFVWNRDGGSQLIPAPPGFSSQYALQATDVSADGSLVTGYLEREPTSSFDPPAFRNVFVWSPATGVQLLADSIGYAYPIAGSNVQVSADGSTFAVAAVGADSTEPVRFTTSGAATALPRDLSGGDGDYIVNAVSADGATIVGGTRPAASSSFGVLGMQATVWNAAGEPMLLPLSTQHDGLLIVSDFTVATDVSSDGRIVAGFDAYTGVDTAVYWADGEGPFQLDFSAEFSSHFDRPVAPGPASTFNFFSRAHAISADGSTIVGEIKYFPTTIAPDFVYDAFVWTADSGLRLVSDLLLDAGIDASDWTFISAVDVSADGRVIVGDGFNPNGMSEGWILDLGLPVPEPSSLYILLGMTASLRMTCCCNRRVAAAK